jgi:hypothetical protein
MLCAMSKMFGCCRIMTRVPLNPVLQYFINPVFLDIGFGNTADGRIDRLFFHVTEIILCALRKVLP